MCAELKQGGQWNDAGGLAGQDHSSAQHPAPKETDPYIVHCLTLKHMDLLFCTVCWVEPSARQRTEHAIYVIFSLPVNGYMLQPAQSLPLSPPLFSIRSWR